MVGYSTSIALLASMPTDMAFKYEGTPHFPVTASSAKIGFWKVNLKPLEGEVP
jgi:hypothetical protein